METIARQSFCPHCHRQTSASWRDGYYNCIEHGEVGATVSVPLFGLYFAGTGRGWYVTSRRADGKRVSESGPYTTREQAQAWIDAKQAA